MPLAVGQTATEARASAHALRATPPALNHPGYRERFGDSLKRRATALSFAPDSWAFSKASRELADWHIEYESKPEFPLKKRWADGATLD